LATSFQEVPAEGCILAFGEVEVAVHHPDVDVGDLGGFWEGGKRIDGVVSGGEAPSCDGYVRTVPLELLGFPISAGAEEVDVLEGRFCGDLLEHFEVVVSGDEAYLDAGIVELLEARLQGADGFEEVVVPVDEVACEEEHIVLAVEGGFDEFVPGESSGGDVVGGVSGAAAHVYVGGGEYFEHVGCLRI